MLKFKLIKTRISNSGGERVPCYPQPVVVRLAGYNERTVLGVQPAVPLLQIKSQLVVTALCQVTEKVVAEPVVASGIIESDFKLRP